MGIISTKPQKLEYMDQVGIFYRETQQRAAGFLNSLQTEYEADLTMRQDARQAPTIDGYKGSAFTSRFTFYQRLPGVRGFFHLREPRFSLQLETARDRTTNQPAYLARGTLETATKDGEPGRFLASATFQTSSPGILPLQIMMELGDKVARDPAIRAAIIPHEAAPKLRSGTTLETMRLG